MRKTVQIFIIFNCFLLINAQNSSSIKIDSKSLNQLVKEYHSIYHTTKSILNTLFASAKNTEEIADTADLIREDDNEYSSDNTLNETKAEKSKINLNWTSDINYNASPGFSEDNIFYRMKVSSGIDWMALGEGSNKNAKTNLEINNDKQILSSLKNKAYQKEIALIKRRNEAKIIFERKKLDLLQLYEIHLSMLYSFDQKQYENHLINESALNNSAFAREKIRLQIQNLETQHEIMSVEKSTADKFFAVAFPSLINKKMNISRSINTQQLEIQKRIFSQQEKKENQLDLRFKLRYNYYMTPERDRNFASIGATFNLPITKSSQQDSHEIALQTMQHEWLQEHRIEQAKIEMMYKEYSRSLTELQILENEKKYLENELQFTSANEDSDTFSPLAFFVTTDKIFKNSLAICDLKAKIFDTFLQIESFGDTKPENINSKPSLNQENAGHETYIWTSFFNNYSNTYIIDLMNHWNVDRVFLSAGNSINTIKLDDFKVQAANNSISVYRLIGENSYAATDNGYPDLELKLIEAKNMGFAGIHLDIEPHTFSDYKDNIPLYSQRLINLFTNAQNWCTQNNMELSVSVPMHLPTDVATALKNNNTKAYIMAYDVLSLDKKLNKTLAIRTILGTNLYSWVFRINDFANYSDLLNAETTVLQAGVTEIGYYDLSQMNNFKP